MAERRSGEVAVPLSAKKIFKRVVPTDMQTAVRAWQVNKGVISEIGNPESMIFFQLCTQNGLNHFV